jgi:UDP-N-acetylglucosamine/UDP-N-acetylgalactosamine diphosphorylase
MTSLVNDQPTRVFFEENAYFGLDPEHVCFFAQGVLPAFGYDGRVLLDTQDSLSLSPNGHGGSLVALRDSGALADMRARGILHVSYWQVDNPLVQMFDPLFLGLHDLLASDMSSRGLGKTGPLEKLGNFCLYPDDSLNVVEYSDMPDDLARQTEADGGLRFRIGSPAIHVIRQDFVERLTAGRLSLPMHRADKKVSHVTADGGRVEPETPNAVKLEMFVFDALPLAHNPIVVEAAREDHFGPVKNAAGVDSVESSQTLLLERGARWLRSAGVRCPAGVELSPRRFLDQDDVREQAPQLPDIEPGEKRLVE